MAYTVEYSPEAIKHIRRLPAHRRATIMDQIEQRLTYEPTVAGRNRKRMHPDKKQFVAPWEQRLGDVRVYYAVEEEAKKVVVLAVGIKERERLFIGGREFEP